MVRFELMNQSQYERYLDQAIDGYADQHVRSGRWTAEEAPEEARAEFTRLLPEGLESPDHYLCNIVDEDSGERVGLIWYWLDRPRERLFLYDIIIDEAHRRRGYGMGALQLLECEARRLGADSIRLHVFGHNRAARALYDKAGYEETNVIMTRRLAPES